VPSSADGCRRAPPPSAKAADNTVRMILFACCSRRTDISANSQADKRTGGAMAVYDYTRVSTSRQAEEAEEGESLDVQQRTIAGYALMLGLTMDRMFSERGVSGSIPLSERAEGAALDDPEVRRRGHHAEAGSHVPFGTRYAGCAREAQGSKR
jgi:hypothetical protein